MSKINFFTNSPSFISDKSVFDRKIAGLEDPNMKNTCNYSDNWQPYINDYDKFEYDIKTKEGFTVFNCYPNNGYFKGNLGFEVHESQVSEIRFSKNPKMGINDFVSKVKVA